MADAIAEYCRARPGARIQVRVVDFLEEFVAPVSVLAKFGYQQSAEFFPAYRGDLTQLAEAMPANPVVHAVATGGMERATEYVREYAPHAVISTFPVAGGAVGEMKKALELVSATLITDYDPRGAWIHPATDLHFVACREARESLVLDGVAWDRIVVSGTPVAQKFAAVHERPALRARLQLADRFTALLVAAAGQSFDVSGVAKRLAGAGIQVAIVTGRNERLYRRMEALARDTALIRVFGHTDDMHAMMRAADVLVGRAGGQVTAEALAVGMPLVICTPVPGQEIGNVDFLVNSGAGLLSRDEQDVVLKVSFLSTHSDRLAQMARNAGTLGRPEAVQTVCERVLAAFH